MFAVFLFSGEKYNNKFVISAMAVQVFSDSNMLDICHPLVTLFSIPDLNIYAAEIVLHGASSTIFLVL